MQTRVSHCTELDSMYASRSSKPVSGTCSGRHGAPTLGVEHAFSSAVSANVPKSKPALASMRWRFTGVSSLPCYPGFRLLSACSAGGLCKGEWARTAAPVTVCWSSTRCQGFASQVVEACTCQPFRLTKRSRAHYDEPHFVL